MAKCVADSQSREPCFSQPKPLAGTQQPVLVHSRVFTNVVFRPLYQLPMIHIQFPAPHRITDQRTAPLSQPTFPYLHSLYLLRRYPGPISPKEASHPPMRTKGTCLNPYFFWRHAPCGGFRVLFALGRPCRHVTQRYGREGGKGPSRHRRRSSHEGKPPFRRPPRSSPRNSPRRCT